MKKHIKTSLKDFLIFEKLDSKYKNYTADDIKKYTNFNVRLINKKGIVVENLSKTESILFNEYVDGYNVGGISNKIVYLPDDNSFTIEWLLEQMKLMKNEYLEDKNNIIIESFTEVYGRNLDNSTPSIVFINNGHNYNDIIFFNYVKNSKNIYEFLSKLGVNDKPNNNLEIIDIFNDIKISNIIKNDIENELNNKLTTTAWKNCWLDYIAWSNGYKIGVKNVWNDFEKSLNKQVIVVISELEEIFKNITNSIQEQKSLEALLQDIPNHLNSRIVYKVGVLIFFKKEFVHYPISQNAGQFLAKYSKFTI